MNHPCEAKAMPAQPVVSIHACVPGERLPQVLGQAFEKLEEYLRFNSEAPAGPPFVAYYNMDMQALEIEIGFPTARPLPETEEIKSREIPAGMYASCLYTGPYAEIAPAYQELTAWIGQNGYEPTGAAIEYYLNEPMSTPPEELKTLIVFPLKG